MKSHLTSMLLQINLYWTNHPDSKKPPGSGVILDSIQTCALARYVHSLNHLIDYNSGLTPKRDFSWRCYIFRNNLILLIKRQVYICCPWIEALEQIS